MKCPGCLVAFHENWSHGEFLNGSQQTAQSWRRCTCPACRQVIIDIRLTALPKYTRVWPKATARPLPEEVPPDLAADFIEACLVLSDSPKASAALSRRCLQHLLRDHAQTKKKDLAEQIDEVLARKELPSHLAEALDAVRQLGNFAAHPMKSKASGEILDVEPHEAEWTLDVLEGLFDFYFVAPAKLKAKRDALNAKLAEAGKPNMKTG